MNAEITVPQVGETTEEEIVIEKWLKKVGDKVKKGEMLLEISYEKANIEIEAVHDGVLSEIVIAEGASVRPLDVVGIIETA